IAAWPVSRLTRRLLRKTREGQQKLGAIAAQVHEGLGGLRTIQAFNGQSAELMRFDAHAAGHLKAMSRAAWTRAATPALMEIFAAAAIAGALAFAALGQGVAPENLVSLVTALVLIYQPAKEIGKVSQFGVQA